MTIIKCVNCDATQTAKPSKKGEAKLPPGWKNHGGKILCKNCKNKLFMLRSITIPVSGPVGSDWKDLREALKKCWEDSTSLANWTVTELARHDTPRTAEQTKLGAVPSIYLYPGARKVVPDMSPTSLNSLIRTVQQTYNKKRFDILWLRKASLPAYRYPVPYPVHNQSWECVKGIGGEPCIKVSLAGTKFTLKLAGGFRQRRKIEAFWKIYSGLAIPGELAILSQEVTKSAHRNGTISRDSGGGRKTNSRVMIKMVAYFPKEESKKDIDKIMYLKTTGSAFFEYKVGSDGESRYIYADHVRRWERQHAERNRRLAHDMKYEKRWPTEVRKKVNESQEKRSSKYHDRINTFVHESTKMIAEYAKRQHVFKLIYDDSDKRFAKSFPWFQVKEKLKYKLDERGIDVEFIEEGEKKDLQVVPEANRKGKRNSKPRVSS
jgi:hypothetical protein